MTHILIVDSRFYEDIADELVKGALQVLQERGTSCEYISVPGAFEIPAAIRFASHTGEYAGYVALGCVIRGETTHYDYVCSESARGLQDLAVQHGLPIGNGILTVENREQALARAEVAQGNKGAAAAHACLEMLKLKQHFGG